MLRKVCKRKLKNSEKGSTCSEKLNALARPTPKKNKNPFTDYVKGVNICRNVIRNPAQKTSFYSVFRGSICSEFSTYTKLTIN
jgi:hypothetical protein